MFNFFAWEQWRSKVSEGPWFNSNLGALPFPSPGARGPRFIEPPEPPVSTPLLENEGYTLCDSLTNAIHVSYVCRHRQCSPSRLDRVMTIVNATGVNVASRATMYTNMKLS